MNFPKRTAGDQTDKIVKSGGEGSGFESSRCWSISPLDNLLSAAAPFLKNDVPFRLINKRSKKTEKAKPIKRGAKLQTKWGTHTNSDLHRDFTKIVFARLVDVHLQSAPLSCSVKICSLTQNCGGWNSTSAVLIIN